MNPYNLEIGPASGIQIPPQIMASDPNYQFPYALGRTYMNNADHTPEFSRLFRGNTNSNIPLNQLNYPNPDGAELFTISGLNLNLRGSTSTQMRPILTQQPPPPSGATPSLQPHPPEDVASSMFITSRGLGNAEAMGYDHGEMSTTGDGLVNNRFMNMDQCADLENYWAPY